MRNHEYHDAVLGSNLSANAKLVALAISYHYNWLEGNKAFPTIKLLEQRTSLSRATIYRAKNEIVESGYMEVKRRFNKPNLYLPVIPTQSQTENKIVSEGRTNYEYNNEDNNEEDASLHSASLGINNIHQEEVTLLDNIEIWRLFENEERNSRRHTAGGSNKIAGRGNKKPRRNYQDSSGVTGIPEDIISREEAYWMGGR